jgi:hypothetical protein
MDWIFVNQVDALGNLTLQDQHGLISLRFVAVILVHSNSLGDTAILSD